MSFGEAATLVTNQPIIIDNGSGMIKAGFAGDVLPKYYAPNFVGRPKYTRVMSGVVEGDHFIGTKASELRGIMKLSYSMDHGIVTNWSDMERIWSYMYSTELRINSEEHPVLLTEAPLNPYENRAKAAEIFFETFNVPALFMSMQAVLALYASGRTTGLVLDCGDGVSHAVPVYEGFALPNAIQRIDVAGRDVTEYMRLLLRRGGHKFVSTSELEIVRMIKEQACYVTLNPNKEEEREANGQLTAHKYTLPDGSVIDLMGERFRAPEILFRPDIIGEEYVGVQTCIVNSISRTDLDLRKTLYTNIILSGGSTMFKGFGDRLLEEVKALAPRDIKIKMAAPPERKFSTWIGGSILASLATFKKMWVSAEDYGEQGVAAINRRFL